MVLFAEPATRQPELSNEEELPPEPHAVRYSAKKTEKLYLEILVKITFTSTYYQLSINN